MNDWGVWFAGGGFAVVVLGVFARFVKSLSRLESRMEKVEQEATKTDALQARLIGQMQVVSETLGAVRLHVAENFVPLQRMVVVEEKIDDLGRRSGGIEATQAEQGAILNAIKDSLTDIKASISR